MKIAYLDIIYDGNDTFEKITDELKKHAPEGVLIDYHYVTGTDNLEYMVFEALVLPKIISKINDLRKMKYDAVILGCFFDPAIDAAKEVFNDIIIVGPGESSILTAAVLGKTFSLITPRKKTVPKTYETIERVGLTSRLASIKPLEIRVANLQKDHTLLNKCMEKCIEETLTQNQAEVIILACTMETGQYRSLQEKYNIPIIDPTIAALMQALLQYNLKKFCNWTYSKKCFYEMPPINEIQKYLGFTL